MGTSAYLLRKYAPAVVACRIRGDGGENFVELAVPASPVPGGAGNGTSAYLLRKSAPAAVGRPGPRHARAQQAGPDIPEVPRTRWSGQRYVCVFASQIRTGFRRLPAPSPARYKRFAFALRSHPGGFESRRYIEKSTAP